MKISDFTYGRDNNFNLIRIVAACAVLVTHSVALTSGDLHAGPLLDTIGMTIGSIAVDIFFISSGFLVTGSLLTRQSLVVFLWARVLRIFPGHIVMLLLTVVGLGLFFTSLPWPTYFTDPTLYKYFLKNLILIKGVLYELPGVFENNPIKYMVNISLWSMVYEIRMYLILATAWGALSLIPKYRLKMISITIVSGAFLAGVIYILAHYNLSEIGRNSQFVRLFFMFFTGSAFFILKDRIVLSHTLFSFFVAALLLASFSQQIFFVVYVTTLAYILIYIAYVPSGFIRKYNSLGDYSYGIYIYGCPIQQSIIALVPGISVLFMIIVSTAVTLVFAILSWHLVEKQVLKLRGHFVIYSRRITISFALANILLAAIPSFNFWKRRYITEFIKLERQIKGTELISPSALMECSANET